MALHCIPYTADTSSTNCLKLNARTNIVGALTLTQCMGSFVYEEFRLRQFGENLLCETIWLAKVGERRRWRFGPLSFGPKQHAQSS